LCSLEVHHFKHPQCSGDSEGLRVTRGGPRHPYAFSFD
jgi:hypothetical protein